MPLRYGVCLFMNSQCNGADARVSAEDAMPKTPPDQVKLPDCPPHVCMEMYSQARYLSGAREMVAGIAKRYGFDDNEASRIALAVDEAISNVIRHCYHRCPDGPIRIRVWPHSQTLDSDAKGIIVAIEDEGPQIDPDSIRGRDLDDVRPGGLGVFIMREVMDGVRFERRTDLGDRGMRVIMCRAVRAPQDEDEAKR
ncbi:MAG: ATP-binding protein [Phycisphaeraceae bacterium]|nr:MAG: ATP-binding protein [Phycisphaeraceae bacterium]